MQYVLCMSGSICQCMFVSLTVCVSFLWDSWAAHHTLCRRPFPKLHLLLAQHIGPADWSRLCIRVGVGTATPLGMTHPGLQHERTPAFTKPWMYGQNIEDYTWRNRRNEERPLWESLCLAFDLEWPGSAVYLDCIVFKKHVLENIIANGRSTKGFDSC